MDAKCNLTEGLQSNLTELIGQRNRAIVKAIRDYARNEESFDGVDSVLNLGEVDGLVARVDSSLDFLVAETAKIVERNHEQKTKITMSKENEINQLVREALRSKEDIITEQAEE